MPTRNRGYLLEQSIQTVLGQSFTDYELIVSDNNSHDNTRQIVGNLSTRSRNIRYINTGRDLSMCANFEYAFEHAIGDYIIYISDDDALVNDALAYIHAVLTTSTSLERNPINVLVWQRGGYGHPDLSLAGHRTRLFLAYRLRTGRLYEVKSNLLLDVLCDFDNQHPNYHFIVPKVINCALSREAMQKCREYTGHFFVPPYPDYTTVCQMLSAHSVYHVIDMPLYICGTSVAANSGLFYKRMDKVKDYFSLFEPGEVTFDGVPYPMEYLTATYLIMTYLKFQKLYPETFNSPINLDKYLAALATELSGFEQIGDDVIEEKKKLAGYMKQHYGSDHVFNHHSREAELGRIKATVIFHLRQIASSGELFRALAAQLMRMLHFGAPDARQYNNVSSIVEAAQIISRDLGLAEKQVTDHYPILISTPEQLHLLA